MTCKNNIIDDSLITSQENYLQLQSTGHDKNVIVAY